MIRLINYQYLYLRSFQQRIMKVLIMKFCRRIGGLRSGLLCAGGTRLATTGAERRAKGARQAVLCGGASAGRAHGGLEGDALV